MADFSFQDEVAKILRDGTGDGRAYLAFQRWVRVRVESTAPDPIPRTGLRLFRRYVYEVCTGRSGEEGDDARFKGQVVYRSSLAALLP